MGWESRYVEQTINPSWTRGDLVGWETYHNWCRDNGLPVLARPSGINQMGDHVYNDNDGLLYVDGKPVGKFLTVCRYTGLDILLKAENVDNAKRFESLRWKILCYLDELYEQRRNLIDKLHEEMGPKSTVRVMHDGDLHKLETYENRDYGRCANGGPVPGLRKLKPLDKLARIPKDTPARVLAAQWFELRDRISRYSAIAGNLGHCLLSILREMHPDIRDRKPLSFSRPCFFEINGRLYPIATRNNRNQDRDYWPNPTTDLPLQVL